MLYRLGLEKAGGELADGAKIILVAATGFGVTSILVTQCHAVDPNLWL
jgi:hypothetical protein